MNQTVDVQREKLMQDLRVVVRDADAAMASGAAAGRRAPGACAPRAPAPGRGAATAAAVYPGGR